MTVLDADWKPEFGSIFTWFAKDRFGRVAVMVNNCFGDLPRELLRIAEVESLLDRMNEYMWEESKEFYDYPIVKGGRFDVDLYSACRHRMNLCKGFILDEFESDLAEMGNDSEASLPVNKGFFVYHAIEGSYEGEDYPVGYDGTTKMGDYFRYLVPTVFASIEGFPEPLRRGIAVSDRLDFTVDRFLDNERINEYFPTMYHG
ncbi:hypothetical protein DMX09_18260 [Pseudomonas protegens]|uniref:hypothetical protein n=1 Tax=Pseudomonas protegens TaxID=380021 RepID=UPI000D86F2A9|nr:hypothetical protein [Pseudomonas protegens]PYC01963.1 hypothetical protein DMX09_18260 [Pseudomonas protegens]